MKKKLLLLGMIFLSFAIFAQEVPSANVTDSDVKNYVKNYDKIAKEIDKLDGSGSVANDVKELKKADDILEKYGISGPNRFKKLESITSCSAYAVGELELEKSGISGDMAKKILSGMNLSVNEKDLTVVKKYAKELSKVYNKD